MKSIEMLGANPDGAGPFEGTPYKLGKNDLKGGTLNLSRFLLRFDLTGFVKNETVSDATLDLNVVSVATVPTPPDPVPIAAMYMLYPADRDWNVGANRQSEAGWFFKNELNVPLPVLWSSTQDVDAPVGENNNGGAGYDPATEVTFTMPVVTGPFTISGFPGLVARALRNPADNFLDLLFRRTDEPTFGAPPTNPPNWTVLFASQYSRTESIRPKLTVETTIQPD